MQTGLRDRHRQARQSGPAADVGDPLAGLDEFSDGRAIQQMALPDTVDFAGTQQAPLHAGGCEQLRVALGELQPIAENGGGRIGHGRHRRCLAVAGIEMFHVKHSSRPYPPARARTTSV